MLGLPLTVIVYGPTATLPVTKLAVIVPPAPTVQAEVPTTLPVPVTVHVVSATLNPVPEMFTSVPDGPWTGVSVMAGTAEIGCGMLKYAIEANIADKSKSKVTMNLDRRLLKLEHASLVR